MNTNILQIALLVFFLVTGLTSMSARADCRQQELCDAQTVVDELLKEIVNQQSAIEADLKTLASIQDQELLDRWFEGVRHSVDVVSRYLHIGTLESSLLVAYNQLGSIKTALRSPDPICHCSEVIQLSAGY